MSALRQGLTYSPKWFDDQEGPYTFLSKIGVVNRLRYQVLLRHVLDQSGQLAQDAASRRFTCNDAVWMTRHSDAESSLATEAAGRALSVVLGLSAKRFAGDEHLRYCPACIDLGFQSALCQIDAIVKCPIHRAPILNTCRRCGRHTPPYAVNAALKTPMRCRGCSQPLGYAWGEHALLRWQALPDTAGYARLADAIRCLSEVRWLDRGGWDEHFSHFTPVNERIAAFGLALKAAGTTIDTSLLHPAVLTGSSGALSLDLGAEGFRWDSETVEEVFHQAWARRLKSIGVDRVATELHEENIKIYNFLRPVEAVGCKDAEVLAALLWCHRFGYLYRGELHDHRRLIAGRVKWAKGLVLRVAQWDAFFEFASAADAAFAAKWCGLTGGLERSDTRWLTLTAQHGESLGSPDPPSMAVLAFKAPDEETDVLTFGLGSSFFPLCA